MLVHHNNFLENNGSLEQGYDDTTNNYWNDTNNRGNYWSDYETRNPSAKHNGYIWDTPYNMTGAVGSNDSYPLVYPTEFEAPNIVDLSGNTGTTGDIFNVICTVIDNIYVNGVFVKYWYGNNIAGAQNKTMTFNSVSGNWKLGINIQSNSNETLKYIISAVDPSNNWGAKPVTLVVINDDDAPIADAGSDQHVYQYTRVFFNGSGSTDNIEISSYTWRFQYLSWNIQRYGMKPNFTFVYAGNYLVELTVVDTEGNNDTDTMWVNVTDNIKPTIFNPDYPSSINMTEQIRIYVRISDTSGIETVMINYTDVNNNTYNVTIPQYDRSTWIYIMPNQTTIGEVNFYFWVKDIFNNWAKSVEYTIQILDNILPKIKDIKYPQIGEVGQSIKITTEVDDNIGFSDVRINYIDTNGKIHNVSMSEARGINYTYIIPSQSKTGTIKFHIWALDSGNNSITSNEYEIEVIKKYITEKRLIITWVLLPKGAHVGESIEIKVKVEDDTQVKAVYLNYTDVNGQIKNDTMEYIIHDNYTYIIPKQEKTGMVTLMVSAENINGYWNQTPIQSLVIIDAPKDENPPKVISSTPKNKDVGIKLDVIVSIIFNESMARAKVASAISISPEVDFELQWLDNDILLKISFTEHLDYDTEYTLTIGLGATDLAGNALAKPFVLKFITLMEPSTKKDTDSDGMDDAWETANGLDPSDPNDRDSDADNDGLTNYQEYENNTNPQNKDTDGDKISDKWEVLNNLNPTVDDAELDPDGDFYTNFEEFQNNTDPNDIDSIPIGEEAPKAEDDYLLTIIAIIIVIMVILILLAVLIKRSGEPKVEPKGVEEEELEEEDGEQQEVECPECGAMFVASEPECPECGAKLELEDEVPEDEEAPEDEETPEDEESPEAEKEPEDEEEE